MKMFYRNLIVALWFSLGVIQSLCLGSENLWKENQCCELFHRAEGLEWQTVLFDPGAKNWAEHWTLDGEKARVTNSEKGMDFHAGPEYGNDPHHAVLWTRKSYRGDVRIDYEYNGLRHTYTRSARYRDFRVSVPAATESSARLDDVMTVRQRLVEELIPADPKSRASKELHNDV